MGHPILDRMLQARGNTTETERDDEDFYDGDIVIFRLGKKPHRGVVVDVRSSAASVRRETDGRIFDVGLCRLEHAE